MEATFVTGPSKNLIGFARQAKAGKDGPGIELSVITYERGENPEPNPFVDAARGAGIAVDLVRERGRFDFAVLPQLRRILDERKTHIVQTHNVKSHFLMRWSGLGEKYVWLAFHHGYTTTDFKMRVYNQLDRWSLLAPRHWVTVCEAFSRDLKRIGVPPERIAIRHNFVQPFPPVEQSIIDRTRSTLAAPPGTPILLSVGRLSHEKGQVDLVRALAELGERPFHLVLAGEGPERAAIEEAVARFQLQDRVTLAGLQHNIAPYYAIADMVVMPSHSEGSPNALLEAMAAGLPIVATHVGGIPEIVTDGETALLVPPHDPKALAGAIERMLTQPEERARLAESALAKARSYYSPEAYCRSLANLYRSLL